MDEPRNAPSRLPRRWLRYFGEAVALVVVLLCVFHRPILQGIGRAAAKHFAKRNNLAFECRLEGSVISDLTIRNLHVTPTGPSIIESIDVDYVHVDYNLLDLLLHGASELLKNVEVRTASVVLNPATAAVKAKVPPDQPLTMPTTFPERLKLTDVNVIFRDQPQEFVLEGLDLELNPKASGEVQIAKLQLPTVPAWTKIRGRTAYQNKNLVISELVLDDADQFRIVGVDASKIRDKTLALTLDASLAGGTIVGSAQLTQVHRSLDTRLHAVVENVSLDTVRGYIGRREGELTGNVARMVADFTGVLDTPRSWNGTVAANVKDLKQGEIAFDNCSAAITARDGVARLDLGEITTGPNSIRVRGSADLPENVREFGRSPANFEIGGAFPDLHIATAQLAQPLNGAANVTGHAQISNARLTADLDFTGGDITIGESRIGQVNGTLHATKEMPPSNTKKPYYADLRSQIAATATDVRTRGYIVDSVNVNAKSVNDLVTVEQIETARKLNTVVLRGDYRLPEDFTKARLQPANVELNFAAVDLGDFCSPDSANKISGPLQLSGSVKMQNGIADGEIEIFGSNLHAQNLTIPEVSGQISIARNVVYLNDLTAKLNDRDYVGGTGQLQLEPPYRYTGKLIGNIADLSTLKPLLAASGNNADLAGALMIDWQGSGTAADLKNTGMLKLTLENGRFANLQRVRANVDATYSPDALDVPVIFLASDTMDFQASMQAKGERLEISKIQVDQGQTKYASGYISLPFVWSNLGSDRPLFPENGKVAVNFQSENLDIKKLLADLGQQPVASGFVNVKADAQGTLADVTGRVDVQMRELRSEMAKVEPATLDLSATLEHNRLAVAGKLQQPKVQPIQLTASAPLDLPKILREKKFDENTPLTAKVQMPRSSVNFVRQFIPEIEQIDGDAALDVNVNGTIARPELSGAADMSVNVARFTNPSLPALTAFKSRVTFDHDTLRLERFGGEVAGGPFNASGRIVLTKLTEPVVDLQLKADSVLLARNDTLTARADANLQVTGPLQSATVTGSVALTNSHLLKNLDLIPIGLPGRPAPQPPEERQMLTFPQRPIRDWKFDIAIRTKDPFQIRGNLAKGGAIVNLHLGGTGLQPMLEGQVRLENVEATLPFSRLEVQYGYLHFKPDDPFNPGVDLHGVSTVRDYTIHAYVYGSANQPEAVFTSEPPLPQEEIISLLATGTTREELTGNNNVLAGRAAMLLFQQLYRKVTKKSGDEPNTNSVFDRLQVDLGNVDPRTGQQTATARFKASQHWVLIGEIAVGGDFRGQVKYLLRFR